MKKRRRKGKEKKEARQKKDWRRVEKKDLPAEIIKLLRARMYSFRRRAEKKRRGILDPPRVCAHTHTHTHMPTVSNPLRTDPVCTPHALSPLPRLSINWRVKQRSYRVGNYLLSFCGPCVTYSEITRRRGNIGEGMERPGILAPSL